MPISERRSFIPPSAEADPVREKYIMRRLRALGLARAAWPKPQGLAHPRLTPGEKMFVFREIR
jgi:hypothetical protein